MSTSSEAYKFESNQLDSPALNAAAITPNDATDLTEATRAIFVGGDGNIALDMAGDGTNIVFMGVVAGTILPVRATRVYSTNTTASNLIALY